MASLNDTTVAKVIELTNETGFIRRFKVVDGTAISQGLLLKITTPRTAAAVGEVLVNTVPPCAGIASMDKEANDGSTSISVWTDGIFDMMCSGAIIIGAPVRIAGGNTSQVSVASNTTPIASGAVVLGYAMETGADGDIINIRVRL